VSDSPEFIGSMWGRLSWSEWIPLDAPVREYQRVISSHGGLYRVRGSGIRELVYIGQTGRNLRERTRSLASGVRRDRIDPPWNDPHTAAPLLWAYRHENDMTFEVSVAELDVDVAERQCWEDMLLYLHRHETNCSTLCNHGRLHPHWTRPSNRKKGIAAMRRSEPVFFPSSKLASGNMDCSADDWLGLSWSPPIGLQTSTGPPVAGVYRLVSPEGMVFYIGESADLSKRLKAHARRHEEEALLASWHEVPVAVKHQLHELESDLIGAFFWEYRHPPVLQYQGSQRRPR
jgi:hypothetical protein